MRVFLTGDEKLTARITRAVLASISLVLFAYSGMLKWIPFFPVDPTILFGICLIIILSIEGAIGIRRISKNAEFAIYSTLAFFSWYLFTAVYTTSDDFWMYKALTLGLSVLAFVAPIVCFKTEAHFLYFDRALVMLAILSITIVLGFYLTGNVEFLIRQGFDKQVTKIPNYLALSTAIGLGTLLCLAKPTFVNISVAVCGLAALLVLGARGPILFTVLMMFMGYFLYARTRHLMRFGFAKYALVITAMFTAFFWWSGAGRGWQRFSAMLTDDGALMQGLRVSEFSTAWGIIGDSPLLGVGLGGYGLAAYGTDENSYPHNLFLEAFAEAGILGLVLMTVSILMVIDLALSGRRLRRGATYFVLAVFLLLNYSKSGGFIGSRDLYMLLGVLIAYVNLHTCQKLTVGATLHRVA